MRVRNVLHQPSCLLHSRGWHPHGGQAISQEDSDMSQVAPEPASSTAKWRMMLRLRTLPVKLRFVHAMMASMRETPSITRRALSAPPATACLGRVRLWTE